MKSIKSRGMKSKKSRKIQNSKKQKTKRGGILWIPALKMEFENRNNCQNKFGMVPGCSDPTVLKCYNFRSNKKLPPEKKPYYYQNERECSNTGF
jgi:hypothetical protein